MKERGIFMSLEKDMLMALERNENDIRNDKSYSNRNSDHDFGTVLSTFSSEQHQEYVFRYPDGKEEVFSFDN